MGVVSACAFSFMSKYLHQSCGPKPMTRVDINDNNQSSNKVLGSSSPCTNYFHVFLSSSFLSREMARIFKGGMWHSGSTHNVVAKYLGNGGILKWVGFL
jgi:hypothetical protein